MTVRCKFWCCSVNEERTEDGAPPTHDVVMRPVTSGSEENERYFAFTPDGKFRLRGLKECSFVEGQEYYIDITPAGEAPVNGQKVGGPDPAAV